ncbi:hypothetical protein AB0D24_41745, partial [Streptomyces javensis]
MQARSQRAARTSHRSSECHPAIAACRHALRQAAADVAASADGCLSAGPPGDERLDEDGQPPLGHLVDGAGRGD